MTIQEAINDIQNNILPVVGGKSLLMAIEALKAQEVKNSTDAISRQDALNEIAEGMLEYGASNEKRERDALQHVARGIKKLPSAEPERKWIPCSNPPKHHRDVLVRGIEAIGNVTVHKVMQWDVDTWRPTDYAPSVMWKEWSEI